jgi:hypothetical protein
LRKRVWIGAGALILAAVLPAKAQYGAPFGSPGVWTAPEVTGGALGAGAANTAAQQQQQQQCTTVYAGRSGPQYQCAQGSSPPAKR